MRNEIFSLASLRYGIREYTASVIHTAYRIYEYYIIYIPMFSDRL